MFAISGDVNGRILFGFMQRRMYEFDAAKQ